MANKLYDEKSIQDIADAIRAKKGSNATYKVADMADAIKSISGNGTLIEFNQENPVVAEYLANTTYDPNDYTTTNVEKYRTTETTYRKDQPSGCIVTVQKKGKIGICDDNKAMERDSVSGDNTLYNITPNNIGKWWNIVDDNIKQSGTIKPTGTVRMIKVDSVHNVRDLGGWSCDGGTVKYGKIFRGGRFNNSDNTEVISDIDINTFRNLLGVKHELDMRVSAEGGVLSKSLLGSDVRYTSIPVGAITTDYTLFVGTESSYVDELKNIIETVFESVKYGIPTYVHCTYGADRTGVIAFILNGLLGVSQSDLDKDFELTSFYSKRHRKDSFYVKMIDYMKSCSNGNMRDCIVAYCTIIGITIDAINEFRQNMIDGIPDIVTANINTACTGISLSATSGTISKNGTVTITATPLPTWTTDTISYVSDDTGVATVTSNGKTATIRGVSGGSATITVTCGGYSATYTITVEQEEETPQYTGNILDTIGYVDGYRLSSDGSNSVKEGYVVTNKIPFKLMTDGTFKMLLSGIEWNKDTNCRFVCYKDETFIAYGYLPREANGGVSGVESRGTSFIMNDDGTINAVLTASESTTYDFNQIAFSGYGSGANAIIKQVI